MLRAATTAPQLALARPTFADPKTDFAFKRIFGSEEHKDERRRRLDSLDADGLIALFAHLQERKAWP